jgi:Glyoxalase/Bleomycin resistance protein/Dioxygenase superfamily
LRPTHSHGGDEVRVFERAKLLELIGRVARAGGPGGEVAFLVEDVDAEAARLRPAGAEILTGPTDRSWGHRILHLLDPDGFVVELPQQIERPHYPHDAGSGQALGVWQRALGNDTGRFRLAGSVSSSLVLRIVERIDSGCGVPQGGACYAVMYCAARFGLAKEVMMPRRRRAPLSLLTILALLGALSGVAARATAAAAQAPPFAQPSRAGSPAPPPEAPPAQ